MAFCASEEPWGANFLETIVKTFHAGLFTARNLHCQTRQSVPGHDPHLWNKVLGQRFQSQLRFRITERAFKSYAQDPAWTDEIRVFRSRAFQRVFWETLLSPNQTVYLSPIKESFPSPFALIIPSICFYKASALSFKHHFPKAILIFSQLFLQFTLRSSQGSWELGT